MLDKVACFLDACIRFLQVKVFPYLVRFFVRLILWTSRVELVGVEAYYQAVKKHPSIIFLWHNRIVLCPNFYGEYLDRSCNYTAYVSESRDGEWLALATESYPNGYTIRVPKRFKYESLRQFIKTLKKSVVLITPDGPRGPKYKMKPGVIFAAVSSKAQLFPFSWSASKTWQLKSWDGLKIPKPFGKIIIGFGEPFFLHDQKDLSLEEKSQIAEEKLEAFRIQLNEKLEKSFKKSKENLKKAPSL